MLIATVLKDNRKRLGLTQVRWSALSGVSLPTIQMLEAGKGNPSLEVLTALARAVGLSIGCTQLLPDWDYLTQAGLPLTGQRERRFRFANDTFVTQLKIACRESLSTRDDRIAEATAGLVLAIRKHYPSWFKKHMASTPVVQELAILHEKNPRILKLSRIALAGISEFL